MSDRAESAALFANGEKRIPSFVARIDEAREMGRQKAFSVIKATGGRDGEGHALAMLNRIAAAMDKRVEIWFVPMRGRGHSKPVVL